MNLDIFKLVFWDFDGVIKDSISVKADAFEELFKPFGDSIRKKVLKHHIDNGGMSRIVKIPLYLKWSGVEPTNKKINEMCKKFSSIVKNKVIKSPWVPGIEKFLKKKKNDVVFIIVSATPQHELIEICNALNIQKYFSKIYGTPLSKSKAIKESIIYYEILPEKCLMIGDALADINAAEENNINFIFRRHKYNQYIKISSKYSVINDFKNI